MKRDVLKNVLIGLGLPASDGSLSPSERIARDGDDSQRQMDNLGDSGILQIPRAPSQEVFATYAQKLA